MLKMSKLLNYFFCLFFPFFYQIPYFSSVGNFNYFFQIISFYYFRSYYISSKCRLCHIKVHWWCSIRPDVSSSFVWLRFVLFRSGNNSVWNFVRLFVSLLCTLVLQWICTGFWLAFLCKSIAALVFTRSVWHLLEFA